jgi:hypothetical protein
MWESGGWDAGQTIKSSKANDCELAITALLKYCMGQWLIVVLLSACDPVWRAASKFPREDVEPVSRCRVARFCCRRRGTMIAKFSSLNRANAGSQAGSGNLDSGGRVFSNPANAGDHHLMDRDVRSTSLAAAERADSSAGCRKPQQTSWHLGTPIGAISGDGIHGTRVS